MQFFLKERKNLLMKLFAHIGPLFKKKKSSGLIICSVSWSAHRNNPSLIYR